MPASARHRFRQRAWLSFRACKAAANASQQAVDRRSGGGTIAPQRRAQRAHRRHGESRQAAHRVATELLSSRTAITAASSPLGARVKRSRARGAPGLAACPR